MLGAHPLPGGPLRRLSQPIRERTCCQRPPALWDVNLSAVRRTPITTHTLRVRRNVALTRKIADSRGQPAAASSPLPGSPADRLVPPDDGAAHRLRESWFELQCCVPVYCPPAHGDPAPDFLSRTPCAAHPRAGATCAAPPVPAGAPRVGRLPRPLCAVFQ